MTTENESVMDVINDALGVGESTETEHEEPLDELGDEGFGEGTTEGAEEGAEGGEPKEGEEDAEGREPEESGGKARERNADGTFKTKEQKAAEEKKEGEKPAQKKEPDAVNDPIPKDAKQETQQRIRTLIDRTKDAESRATKAAEDFNYMVQGVQATGASPEQYGEVLSWLSLFNSNDPKQQGQALDLLENVADRLATLIGRERTASDPLATHKDLVEAVQRKEITEKYAKEVARTRNQGAFRNELTNTTNQQARDQQAAEQERTQARADLNALETRLSRADPHYAAKKAQLVPVLQVAFASMRPNQWAKAFEDAFKKVRVGTPVAFRKGGVPPNQPMRPKGSGGGGGGGMSEGDGGPKSMLDAINGALARNGR